MKHGITVINSPGTIDADYRGELRVPLINLSNEPFTIQDGERIAQMVVARHEVVEWQLTTELSDTDPRTRRLRSYRQGIEESSIPFSLLLQTPTILPA